MKKFIPKEKLVKKAQKAGFAWPGPEGALGKLDEEVAELREAVRDGSNIGEELGDVLFAVCCTAAMTEQDPEMVLHSACEKFIRRFTAMEQAARAQCRCLENCDPEEQISLWNAAKAEEA